MKKYHVAYQFRGSRQEGLGDFVTYTSDDLFTEAGFLHLKDLAIEDLETVNIKGKDAFVVILNVTPLNG